MDLAGSRGGLGVYRLGFVNPRARHIGTSPITLHSYPVQVYLLFPVVRRHVFHLLELFANVGQFLIDALLLHLFVRRVAHVLDEDVEAAHARGGGHLVLRIAETTAPTANRAARRPARGRMARAFQIRCFENGRCESVKQRQQTIFIETFLQSDATATALSYRATPRRQLGVRRESASAVGLADKRVNGRTESRPRTR